MDFFFSWSAGLSPVRCFMARLMLGLLLLAMAYAAAVWGMSTPNVGLRILGLIGFIVFAASFTHWCYWMLLVLRIHARWSYLRFR